MNNFAIYCTEAQMNKALELGAPIPKHAISYKYIKPTAEEMMGWLDEQGIIIEIVRCDYDWSFRIYNKDNKCVCETMGFYLRKECTLASIGEALNYMIYVEKNLSNKEL